MDSLVRGGDSPRCAKDGASSRAFSPLYWTGLSRKGRRGGRAGKTGGTAEFGDVSQKGPLSRRFVLGARLPKQQGPIRLRLAAFGNIAKVNGPGSTVCRWYGDTASREPHGAVPVRPAAVLSRRSTPDKEGTNDRVSRTELWLPRQARSCLRLGLCAQY